MQWPSTEPKKKSTRTKKLSVSLTNMGPRTAGSAVDGDRAVLTVEEVVFVCFFFVFFGGGIFSLYENEQRFKSEKGQKMAPLYFESDAKLFFCCRCFIVALILCGNYLGITYCYILSILSIYLYYLSIYTIYSYA